MPGARPTGASNSKSSFRKRSEAAVIYLVVMYWPFLVASLIAGIAVGWWYQDPRSADDASAWLEPGTEEL